MGYSSDEMCRDKKEHGRQKHYVGSTLSKGVNMIKYPNSPSCKGWILGIVYINLLLGYRNKRSLHVDLFLFYFVLSLVINNNIRRLIITHTVQMRSQFFSLCGLISITICYVLLILIVD